jgi:hypothetical protein
MLMRGRRIKLSIQRRMVIDFLYFARAVPTVPVQKHMSVGELVAARAACHDRPRWTAIFVKAFALVAEEVPELRRAYVKIPWPHLYEYSTSRASVVIERDDQGEPALCPVPVKNPAGQPLRAIGELLERASTVPLENMKEFRRWKRFTRVPRPLRRLSWWIVLNIGLLRGKVFGTFGVSVYSALKTESLHPLSPFTALLNYGVIDRNGAVTARIMYDHRVMDGPIIARALRRMEEILNSVILEEVRSLPRSPVGADGQPVPKTAVLVAPSQFQRFQKNKGG